MDFIPIYSAVDDVFGVIFLFKFHQERSISKILKDGKFGGAVFFVNSFF